jgi:predicted anti-sigma-YlaC factor YlaD
MPDLLAHHRLRRAVDAYLDGELPPDVHAAVAHHLSMCWRCSIAAETLRLLKRALSQQSDRTSSVGGRRLRCFAEQLGGGGQPDGATDRWP